MNDIKMCDNEDEYGSDSDGSGHSAAPDEIAAEVAEEVEAPAPFVYATVDELVACGRLDPSGVEVFDRGDAIGKSVRALKSFQRNDIVCSYGGKVQYTSDERCRLFHSDYKYMWNKSITIDGHPTHAETRGHMGSYLNDALGPVRLPGCKNNVRFCNGSFIDAATGEKRPVVWIRAVRSIEPGDELWLSYSRQYWRMHNAIQKRAEAKNNKLQLKS